MIDTEATHPRSQPSPRQSAGAPRVLRLPAQDAGQGDAVKHRSSAGASGIAPLPHKPHPASRHELGDPSRSLAADPPATALTAAPPSAPATAAPAPTETRPAVFAFADMFRDVPVPALLLDGRGAIVDANTAAHDQLELSLPPFSRPRLPVYQFVASQDDEQRLRRLLQDLTTGAWARLEDVSLHLPAGRGVRAALRLTRLAHASAAPDAPRYLCVLDSRAAALEAERAVADAEQRTELARAAVLAKSQLLSRMSHELRTPLNAVIGFSQLLLREEAMLGRHPLSHVQHILQAGRQLLALVDEMLELNRVEAGHLVLDLQPVSIGEIVQAAIEQQQPMSGARGLRVFFDAGSPPDGRAHAMGDPRRVFEVLTNLVSNAIKYNREGGWIRLSLLWTDESVRVAVRDGGIGMTEDQIAHLFEPFNRLGAERLAIAGNGLGLSIARATTIAMGGTLEVSAVVGEGTCFVLELPRAPARDLGGTLAAQDRAAAAGSG